MEKTVNLGREFRENCRLLIKDMKQKERELQEESKIPAKIRLDQLFKKEGDQ